jgi:hypothetical protein
MLDKHAWWFFVLAELLTGLNRELGLPPPQAFAPPPLFTGLGGLGGGIGMGGFGTLGGILSPPDKQQSALALSEPTPPTIVPPNTLSQDEGTRIIRILGWVDSACNQVGMVGISKDIVRAKRDAGGMFADRQKMAFHVGHITERIVEELEEQSFLYIAPDKVQYYQKNDIFGADIGNKFPKSREDLTNAGTAFAVGLNTSCVFHLMRVMEHCVQRFGRRLNVNIDVSKASWYEIMEEVNKQVKAMPGGKNSSHARNLKKQRFSAAAGRLDHVRLVWRNDVMHPKATYDAKEAFDVLTSVQAFLESIVRLV